MEGERPVNLLSIDGGFSGLSSLFILKEVFSRIKYDIKSEEDLRPCDWFDMMIGTDTGGIVVLLLGALKLTLEQAIKAHMELEKYMPVSTSPSSDLECINNPEKFKGVFVEILKSVGLQVDSAMQASEVKGWTGKTIICTTEFSRPGALHLLRSYMPREEEAPTSTILQAACAAIASHNYFDTVAIGEGNNRLELMSALTSFANPTSVLLKEAARELGGDTWASTVISIGGRSMSSDSEGVILAQRPEEVHQYLQQRFHNVYFRLDIQHQSRNIYDNVLAYMSGASGNFLIGEAVRSLSLRQRRRTLSDLSEYHIIPSTWFNSSLASMKQVEVRLKPRPSVVPYFVGQKDILDALRSTHLYDSPSQSDIPTISVLTGIGGSGKTQISLKFAREYEEIYPEAPVYFVNGSSETALKCDLEAIIRSQGADYQSKTFEDAIIWLASKSRRWLMIADNVDDPSVNLTPLIPKARYGHVIITSRDPTRLGLADQGNRHRVGELEQQAAIELLLWLSSYPANSSNEILAVDIAAELGYHPLALSHAGAYIAIHGGMSSYLETYRRNRNAMMGHLSPGLLSDYNVTVAGTIEISFTRLSQASRDILHLLSHFQINSIEEEIIVKAAERGFGHIAYRSAIEPGPEIEECANLLMRMLCPNGQWSQHDFNLLLDPCLRCSLLQSGENEKSGRYFSVHPLVRSWILTQKETHVGPSMQALFIRLLASSITIGKNYEHLVFNQTLRPHIRLVDEKNVRYIGDKHAISIVLRENGDNHLAMDYVESCLVEEKALLGEDHPNTLGSMRDLSICYHKVGRYEEALEMGVKVMKLHQKILGSEHPTTLSSMRIVSICYSKVGEYDNALEMGVEAMRLCQVRLGNEHPATLSSMHNVSICYSKVGERTMALEVGVKAMELRQKILGNEHPETLSSMHNVSICYFKVGKHNDALEMAVKVMELRQKILGNEHPDTLSSMDNVSTYYSEVGKHKDALEMADKVTELRQKVLGGEHQNTLSSMHTVSTVSFAAGIYTDPIHMDVETMKLDPTPLGTEYADALTSFPYTIDSQIDSSGDPFLKLFSLQGIDVTEGGHVELHVSPILDLIDDELKAEIGELEVLSASVIRDHNEFFLGKFVLVVAPTEMVPLTVD
ncbi:hypothetical protein CPB86DRAFT_833403 [Serendipita vermifera]|nr:hypothetical protein CPB86DRAFT_833403 [Serendipita vermifera]